jgi:GNAT superfamily N-acetyltransferase
MADSVITKGYAPGAIGRISELHAAYYHDHWGFGLVFEAQVAAGLSDFLMRYDESRDGIWIARHSGRVEGSIAIDGIHAGTEGAHLRWYIVSETLQGRGIGSRLLKEALDFCGERRFGSVHLWTFAGLDPARHLYEKAGFRLVEQQRGTRWGTVVTEQRYELKLE